MYAADAYSDSIFVTVDGQPTDGYLWDFTQNTDYEADYVSQRYGDDPVEVSLSAGQHNVTVYAREENARLDKLALEPVSGGLQGGGRLSLLVSARLSKRADNRLSKAQALLPPPAGQVYRSYYYAGEQRVAVRVQGDPEPAHNGVFYLLADHLGSTSVTVDSSGNKVAELRYKPWGQIRHEWGETPTDFQFTGQRWKNDLGLYHFGARWYDPALGRFTQADTIIPDKENAQSWERYAYSLNNPLAYTDPTGHAAKKTEKVSTQQKKAKGGYQGPPPPSTPTPPLYATPIVLPGVCTAPPWPYYAPGNTPTPTPTPTATPQPITWGDVENAFDSIAAPSFRPLVSKAIPPGALSILVETIENRLAVLWSIKEILKSPIFRFSSYYSPSLKTPTPYMRTPTSTPTPRFRPTRTPTPTRIPYR